MNRWFNYLLEKFPALRRFSPLRRRAYTGRHRSNPAAEVQYSHDPTSTGTLVAMPRPRRGTAMIQRSVRHVRTAAGRVARTTSSDSGSKEPASTRPVVGRVSRKQVELIATLTVAVAMAKIERLALTTGPSYNFTQT